MYAEALKLAKSWATNPYFDENTRKEVQKLIEQNDEGEIIERFHRDLEFGTGGLRSILGAGSNRMNKYQVRKATQALCNQLKKMKLPISVCIGYDTRKFSQEFATEVASVVAGNGGKAYLFDKFLPVPLLSYSIRIKKAQAGVMITASHNPKIYNGYKLFWNDGGQVIPPIDGEVINEYNQINDWSKIEYLDFKQALEKNLIEYMGKAEEEKYHEMLYAHAINPELCLKEGDKLNLIYTSIHGTGINAVPYALKKLGIKNVSIIEKQAAPDADFSTVKSPNPENPEALTMAIDEMLNSKADICFGTDPDCDRLGLVVNHHGKAEILNGNQVAVLLLHYISSNKKEQNKMPAYPVAMKTIVTSELQTTIAKHFGVRIESTLTGFKWMGKRFNELSALDPKLKLIFSSEESYGYLGHDQCRDKDGVSACVLAAEMALYYKKQNMTLVDALDKIYDQFGFAYEGLLSIDYLGLEGAKKIERIMNYFRLYKSTLAGEEIEELEDYLSLELKNFVTGEKKKIEQTKSNVLGFKFKSGNKLYLRPSGTEPKIKFYTMVQEKTGSLAERKLKAGEKVSKMEAFIKKEVENV